MSSPARLLIVEENGLFRQCLASALASAGVFEVVGQAGVNKQDVGPQLGGQGDGVVTGAGLADDLEHTG